VKRLGFYIQPTNSDIAARLPAARKKSIAETPIAETQKYNRLQTRRIAFKKW
jgi:hypothetical protein